MNTSGIYALFNTRNGKLYVGSSVHITRRWAAHRRELRRGKHTNRFLQRAWDKHGEAAFEFRLLEEVDELSRLLAREQVWLDSLRSFERERGYNLSPSAHSILGFRFDDVQKARVSDGLRGKAKTPEHRKNLWRNRQVTEEFRATMAANGRKAAGRSFSPEHKRKKAEAQTGSKNHRAKIDERQVAELKRRLAAGEKGRTLAREFNVHESIVSEIKSGKIWTHVTI